MGKSKRIRLLSTWILAAALLSAVAAEALGAVGPRTWGRAYVRVSAPAPNKRLPRPLSGEPDIPAGGLPSTGSASAQLPLALQIRLGFGVLTGLPHP